MPAVAHVYCVYLKPAGQALNWGLSCLNAVFYMSRDDSGQGWYRAGHVFEAAAVTIVVIGFVENGEGACPGWCTAGSGLK